jgi:predicted porin
MKKYALLLALALAAGAVTAQTAPKLDIYGKVQLWEESYKSGTTNSYTKLTNDSSRIGFKLTDDVGDGLTAGFQLETGVSMDAPAATTLGDRISILSLGLKDVGTLGVGRHKHSAQVLLDDFAIWPTSYAWQADTTHSAQGVRIQNAMFFKTAPVAGFTARYEFANAEAANTNNVQSAGLNYEKGPFSAGVAYYNNADSTSTTNSVGAKYKFATGTTVSGIYSDDKVSSVSTTASTIGASQTFGKATVLASYGKINTGDTASAVGVAYAMNKALTFHARAGFIDATTDITQYGVGAQYNF